MVWFNIGKNRSICNIQFYNVDGKGCMRNNGSVYLKYIRNEEWRSDKRNEEGIQICLVVKFVVFKV